MRRRHAILLPVLPHLPNGDKSSQLLKSEHQGLSDPKVAAGGSLSAAGMAPKQPKSERDTARLLPDKVERSIALPADEFSDSGAQ